MTPKQEAALRQALEALKSCEMSNYGRDWVWPATAHETAMKNVKEAITAIREALAEQPAQQDGPVNEGWQLTVANGHSGYGVYAHMEDYPEEGAVLVQSIEQTAQQQEPVALDRLYIEALIEGLYQNEDPVSIDAAEEFERLLKTPASPPASKPWVGLTQQDIDIAFDDTQEGGGFDEFARAIEAKLKERNT